MEEICVKCGLPKNLCVCEEIAKEEQKIRITIDSRRFGKIVTKIQGLEKDIGVEELCKQLKKHFACGGTVKNNEIELQGNHREKVKKFLLTKGFKEELIDG